MLLLLVAPVLAQSSLSYDLNVVIDYDSGAYTGHASVHYTNSTGLALSELFFRLFANDSSLYGTAFVTVREVTIQTASMPFSLFLDDTVLMIPLDMPLQPEEPIQVDFMFAGQTSEWPQDTQYSSHQTGYGLLTKSASALTMTTFYPMLAIYTEEGWALDPSTGFGDMLMGDTADYSVQVTARTGPIPVSSGELVTARSETISAVYTFTAKNARDFALVLVSEDYVPSTVVSNDATVRTWFTPQHQEAGLLARDMGAFSFQLYEELVGPSPLGEIDFVEVPLQNAAGVEFSGLILVGSQYSQQPDDLFFSVIISHEMAHQWFYAGIGNDVSEHPWLDESFATYLSYEFLDAYFGSSTAQTEMDTWRRAYESAQDRRPDLSVTSPKYAFPDSSIYSSFVYSGGATLIFDLRTTLGDDAFYRGLQTYYSEHLFKIATPADLMRAFEDACICQIDNLFLDSRIMP
ncbi:M1 family metallopeptidase [Candidatus Bipolaricaulota bacterium]